MCSSCGCGDYTHQHPHSHSIVWDDIVAAAKDAGVSPRQVTENLMDAVDHMPLSGQVVKAINEQRFLLMVGYSPNRLPLRGADGYQDIASPAVVEKACWRFMANGAGAGLLHKEGGEDAFKVVENYIYRNPVPWVLKADDGSEVTIREGDWVIGAICSKETWADYKAGKYGSGSVQGGAVRGPVSAETLARQRSN